MSIVAIRAALETHLAVITPAIATAWENDEFTPPEPTVPYQAVHLMLARPDNSEIGPHAVQRGFLQVSLRFPIKAGSGDAAARAELVKATFPRPTTCSALGVDVLIDKTPEVLPAFVDDGRFVVTVRVPFTAQVAA
ncbi:MAG: hypothetical protein HY859_09555 [Caulobacterales bacterium]|nr:hypothetical protein [Caulobacterales bacterium]